MSVYLVNIISIYLYKIYIFYCFTVVINNRLNDIYGKGTDTQICNDIFLSIKYILFYNPRIQYINSVLLSIVDSRMLKLLITLEICG